MARTIRLTGVVLAITVPWLILPACGGGEEVQAGREEAENAPRAQTYGHPDVASQATRTVEVRMLDEMGFEPEEIDVEEGEVVTFRLMNVGAIVHEFTIGGPKAHELHELQMASMELEDMSMKDMKDMESGGPQAGDPDRLAELEDKAAVSKSVHVAPGETKEVTWAFAAPELPQFGCHVPGHWGSGMQGAFE